MRLGDSIIGGKPMRIPGIVDTYMVGNEWVARSWPKEQNQPNSPAQLLWRKKFKDAHAMIKSWSGPYVASWRAMECPVGKMWIDIAMTSIMRAPTHFFLNRSMNGVKWTMYVPFNDYYLLDYPMAIFGNNAAYLDWLEGYGMDYLPGETWQDVLKWNDLGMICPKGKRPKKKWGLTYAAAHLAAVGAEVIQVDGLDCVLFVFNFAPKGMVLLDNYIYPGSPGVDPFWSLDMPPLYLKPKLFTGVFDT